MEGSAAYARSYLKADLRNTWTLLRLLEEDVAALEEGEDLALLANEAAAEMRKAAIALRQLERLVHDVTVGLRESTDDVDLDALRRFVEEEAAEAARERRIADDTLRQWARSFERVLPWWETLPPTETLLDDSRWQISFVDALAGAVALAGEVELRITADERFRILRVDRTRDAVQAHFEKYLSKHPQVRSLKLVDSDDETVATCVIQAGAVRWIG